VKGWRTARWTSSSARTGCCRGTSRSRTSARGDRRGAEVRGCAQGTAEEDAGRRRRADAVGHADSAHRCTWRSRDPGREPDRHPPEDRLSIRTFVVPFSGETIREAVDREIRRGGQVFFVHNRVRPSLRWSGTCAVLPDARIAVGTGRWTRRPCPSPWTTSRRVAPTSSCAPRSSRPAGSPNANTILVNHAHRFGWPAVPAPGRVGRDRHRAYAYFIVPKDVALTKDATRRLAVLEELTELGSGFRVASHDLEIRGAGNLLGRTSRTDPPGGVRAVHAAALRAVAEISGIASSQEEEPELELRVPHSFGRLHRRGRRAAGVLPEAVVGEDRGRRGRDRDGPAGPVRPASRPARALCDLARMRAGMRAAGVAESARDGSLFLTSPPTPVRPGEPGLLGDAGAENLLLRSRGDSSRCAFRPGSRGDPGGAKTVTIFFGKITKYV